MVAHRGVELRLRHVEGGRQVRALKPRIPGGVPASSSRRRAAALHIGPLRSNQKRCTRGTPLGSKLSWIVQEKSGARFLQGAPAGLSTAKSADLEKPNAEQHKAKQEEHSGRSDGRPGVKGEGRGLSSILYACDFPVHLEGVCRVLGNPHWDSPSRPTESPLLQGTS